MAMWKHLLVALGALWLGAATVWAAPAASQLAAPTQVDRSAPIEATAQADAARTLSQAELEQIFYRLAQVESLRAQFSQSKRLAAVEREYRSSGSVLFERERGILWLLDAPVAAQIVVGRKKIIQQTARTRTEIALANSPYAGVANLLLEVMAGNQQQLERHFALVAATGSADGPWQITMAPKSAVFKQMFSQLQLQGGELIEQLQMTEANGSSTQIVFSELASNSPLSEAEHALLSLAQ